MAESDFTKKGYSLIIDGKYYNTLDIECYGHGAVEVAHYLSDIADYFGVATIDEGVELRKAGLKQPILLLGYNSPSLYYKNLEYGVDQTIYCYDTAKAMSEAAVKAEKTARIHIALDTGMTRIGLSPDEKGGAIVEHIANLPNIKNIGRASCRERV